MNLALWIVQGLLAGVFLMAGLTKFNTKEKVLAKMPALENIPESQIKLIGLVEVLGAIGLILPMLLNIQPILTVYAAIGLAMNMIVAAGLHIKRKEMPMVMMNLVLIAGCAFVIYGRSGWF